ncbi:MAG: helix-turn-helix domain-containing protein [Treponema sp.]|jgi:hypothetical protein|nr:helix-turn-helix domain-containing protein [Treponema sp.]
MIDERAIEGLREYLKDNYISFPAMSVEQARSEVIIAACLSCEMRKSSFRDFSDDASEYIKKNKKPGSFAHALDKKREEKGLSPSELYKKANIDRRLYSRFMGPEGRHPSKNTTISFALALGLDRKEFDELLQTAGFALSNTSSRDVCIMYCLENSIYDIDDVNALLFAIGLEPLTRE